MDMRKLALLILVAASACSAEMAAPGNFQNKKPDLAINYGPYDLGIKVTTVPDGAVHHDGGRPKNDMASAKSGGDSLAEVGGELLGKLLFDIVDNATKGKGTANVDGGSIAPTYNSDGDPLCPSDFLDEGYNGICDDTTSSAAWCYSDGTLGTDNCGQADSSGEARHCSYNCIGYLYQAHCCTNADDSFDNNSSSSSTMDCSSSVTPTDDTNLTCSEYNADYCQSLDGTGFCGDDNTWWVCNEAGFVFYENCDDVDGTCSADASETGSHCN